MFSFKIIILTFFLKMCSEKSLLSQPLIFPFNRQSPLAVGVYIYKRFGLKLVIMAVFWGWLPKIIMIVAASAKGCVNLTNVLTPYSNSPEQVTLAPFYRLSSWRAESSDTSGSWCLHGFVVWWNKTLLLLSGCWYGGWMRHWKDKLPSGIESVQFLRADTIVKWVCLLITKATCGHWRKCRKAK